MEKTVRIWVDGGSSGNPGRGAIAFWVDYDKGRFLNATTTANEVTNNQSEYMSVLLALLGLKELGFNFEEYKIIVYSDSQLVVNQLNGEWVIKDKILGEMATKINDLISNFKSWEIKWIPNEENKACDNLVKFVLYGKP